MTNDRPPFLPHQVISRDDIRAALRRARAKVFLEAVRPAYDYIFVRAVAENWSDQRLADAHVAVIRAVVFELIEPMNEEDIDDLAQRTRDEMFDQELN